MFLARVSYFNNSNPGNEGSINCSIGVPAQLPHTETTQNRLLDDGASSLAVTGAITAASPFTAFLNCAGVNVGLVGPTTFIAIKVGSLVIQ